MNNIRIFRFILFGVFFTMLACNPAQKIASPKSVGLNSDSLKLAEKLMQKYVDEGKLSGVSTMVLKNGKMVERLKYGYADLESKKPIEDNTIFRIYSMTKPVTAVALMTLYEEGKFQLDDKVSKFIPGFAGTKVYKSVDKSFILENPVNEITVRHLLTHTSGISYGWDPKSYVDSLYRVAKVGGWDGTIGEKVKILTGLPLNFQPGTEWKYGLSIDVAGYLVEVLSGMPLDVYMKTRIFDPLKMEDTGFYVPEKKLGRLAQMNRFNKEGVLKSSDGGFNKPVTLFSGGGGLVSTMNDYSRFCRMLLNGGTLDGKKILKPETVKMIMTNQLPKTAKYKDGYGYGLAGEVNLSTGEYSWSGAASTTFCINPENDLIIITLTQLMPSDYEYAGKFKKMVKGAIIK
ncbi:MAG: serine hydrolase domain-containing protein [Mariniphaga sp.]